MAITIAQGKSIHVQANMLDAQTLPVKRNGETVTWESDDETVATVTPVETPASPTKSANQLKAKITGVAPGTCNVTCQVGSVTGTLAVTVYEPTLNSVTITTT